MALSFTRLAHQEPSPTSELMLGLCQRYEGVSNVGSSEVGQINPI